MAVQYPSLYITLPRRAGRIGRQAQAEGGFPQAQYGLPDGGAYAPVPQMPQQYPTRMNGGMPQIGQGMAYGGGRQVSQAAPYSEPMGGFATMGGFGQSGRFGTPPTTRPGMYPQLNAAANKAGIPAGMANKYPTLFASGLDADPNYQFQPMPPAPQQQYVSNLQAARGTPGQGLMTNEQARTAGMNPSMTVGGAWGRQAGERKRFNPATGQYEGSQLGAGGYQNPQAMAASQFGGLTPRMGTTAGGAQRAGYYDGPPLPAAQGMGWDNAVALAVARNPSLSVTDTGGVMGSPPSPGRGSPGLSVGELGANRQAYVQRREQEIAQRQAGVEANAAGRQDARRQRLGNYTMEERLQAGVPGYAVAGLQAGAMRDVAGINADAQRSVAEGQVALGDRQLGLQRELAQKQLEYQGLKDSGDRAAAKEARTEIAGLQRDLKKMEVDMQGKVLADSQQRWQDKFGLEKEGVDIARQKEATALSEQYRQAAKEARANKDFAEAQRLEALANQALPQGMQPQAPGLPGQAPQGGQSGMTASTLFPNYQERLAIQQEGPKALLKRLQAMADANGQPLTSADINSVTREMFPRTTVSAYNQDGWGLADAIGGYTGLENWNRFGQWASGTYNGPRLGLPGVAPGQQPPVPVLPFAGALQTYLGY